MENPLNKADTKNGPLVESNQLGSQRNAGSRSTMRAIAVSQDPQTNCDDITNSTERPLALADIKLEIPTPSANEVLIKVEHVALNQADGKFSKAGCSAWDYPHVIGLDAVGTVHQNNINAGPMQGRRVIWHHDVRFQGVLAEYVCVPIHILSELPANVNAKEAVSLPTAGIAAYLALEKMSLNEQQTVLIKGAASSVGQCAIQLAANIGYRVFATSKPEHHSWLKSLGAEHVFDPKSIDLHSQIRSKTIDKGVDGILDTVGHETTGHDLSALKFGGSISTLVTFDTISCKQLFVHAPTINVISLVGAWLSNELVEQHKMTLICTKLMECFAKGKIKAPKIIDVPFEANAVEYALEKQLQGQMHGKPVITL